MARGSTRAHPSLPRGFSMLWPARCARETPSARRRSASHPFVAQRAEQHALEPESARSPTTRTGALRNQSSTKRPRVTKRPRTDLDVEIFDDGDLLVRDPDSPRSTRDGSSSETDEVTPGSLCSGSCCAACGQARPSPARLSTNAQRTCSGPRSCRRDAREDGTRCVPAPGGARHRRPCASHRGRARLDTGHARPTPPELLRAPGVLRREAGGEHSVRQGGIWQ